MKLGENTIKILKNFSGINPSIYIRSGSLLATKSIAGNILAEAVIDEEFPIPFGIYDLNEFLGTLKLFSSPILDFSDAENNYMYIREEDDIEFNVRYTFGDKDRIIYPKRRPVMESDDVTFHLTIDNLNTLTKASNIMQLPNMVITNGGDDNISITVTDIKNPSSNNFSIIIKGKQPENDYKLIFNMDTFKMIPNDYDVSICKDVKASFESDMIDYYIGLAVGSEMNE